MQSLDRYIEIQKERGERDQGFILSFDDPAMPGKVPLIPAGWDSSNCLSSNSFSSPQSINKLSQKFLTRKIIFDTFMPFTHFLIVRILIE